MAGTPNSDVKTDSLVGGNWSTGQGNELVSTSPTDDSVVWQGRESSTQQVTDACAAARQAAGAWWDTPLEKRIAIVKKYAEIVESMKDELARLISHEMGKPFWEAKTEAGAVVGKAAVSLEAMETRRGSQSFPSGDVNAVTRYKPFGVLGVIGPFNFPAHLANGHIIPALLAGNTIVFKPSEQTPAVGAWMVQRWQEAGLPDGVMNLVQGGRDIGIAISTEHELDGLLFTGSSAGGRALHKTFAQWPQKMLALEMGGNNPLIVHEAKDLKAAAYLTVLSAYITAGQRCTCARRLILPETDRTDEFVDVLKAMIPGIRCGLWTDDPEPFSGTVINKAQGDRLMKEQEALISDGAIPILPMTQDSKNAALLTPGLVDATPVESRSDEEVFGPLLQIIRVPDFDAAIAEANNTSYGLSAALLSDSRECFDQFIHQIRAGVVNLNRQTTGASGKLSFGGCGLSGNNRPSGFFAIDYCNWPVSTLEAETLALPETTMNGIEL